MNSQAISRRGAIQLGAGALIATAVLAGTWQPTALSAQDAPAPPTNVYTDGVAGGGMVPTGIGRAQFSLAAFAVDPGDGRQPVLTGHFSLQDISNPDDPVQIESEMISSVSAFSTELPDAREVIGWARVNGNGPYPFLLQVEDLGPAGSGGDIFNFVFGDSAAPYVTGGSDKSQICDCGGYAYSLKGVVTMGDIVRFPMSTA